MIEDAKQHAATAVNAALTLLYWRVGERIRREVLGGERASYGDQAIAALASTLQRDYGRGFAEKSLRRMVQFADCFPDAEIVATLSRQLSFSQKDLEDAVLRELEAFVLELGTGFCFVARQMRLQIDGDDFYVDLVFYNRKLKRIVAIELKVGDFKPEFKGQMELYLRWLDRHAREPGEESPLGIILCAGKKAEQIELARARRDRHPRRRVPDRSATARRTRPAIARGHRALARATRGEA